MVGTLSVERRWPKCGIFETAGGNDELGNGSSGFNGKPATIPFGQLLVTKKPRINEAHVLTKGLCQHGPNGISGSQGDEGYGDRGSVNGESPSKVLYLCGGEGLLLLFPKEIKCPVYF